MMTQIRQTMFHLKQQEVRIRNKKRIPSPTFQSRQQQLVAKGVLMRTITKIMAVSFILLINFMGEIGSCTANLQFESSRGMSNSTSEIRVGNKSTPNFAGNNIMTVEVYKVGSVSESYNQLIAEDPPPHFHHFNQHVDIFAVVFRNSDDESIITANAWAKLGRSIHFQENDDMSFWVKAGLLTVGSIGAVNLMKDVEPAHLALLSPVILDMFKKLVFTNHMETSIGFQKDITFFDEDITSLHGGSFSTIILSHSEATTLEFHEIITEVDSGPEKGRTKIYYADPIIVPGAGESYLTNTQLDHIIKTGGEASDELE